MKSTFYLSRYSFLKRLFSFQIAPDSCCVSISICGKLCVCNVLVCEYYAHIDCQDFVVSDCKECATYVPQKDSVSIVSIVFLSHDAVNFWYFGNMLHLKIAISRSSIAFVYLLSVLCSAQRFARHLLWLSFVFQRSGLTAVFNKFLKDFVQNLKPLVTHLCHISCKCHFNTHAVKATHHCRAF